MQCPSCQFENMPGLSKCGRCGSLLSGSQIATDILPPRASKHQKWMRKSLPTIPWNHDVSNPILARIRPRFDSSLVNANVSETGILARLIIPGWPHFYCGWTVWGWVFLISYITLMAFCFLTLGSALSGLFFGSAVAVHAVSCASLFRSEQSGVVERFLTSAAAILFVCVLIYFPLTSLFYRITHPLVLNQDSPPFLRGDTFFTSTVNAGTAFERGQVVVFRPTRFDITQPGRIYRIDGPHVDRILAVGGDRVSVKSGDAFINGEKSAFRPLNDAFRLPDFETVIPEGYVLIFPSSEVILNGRDAAAYLTVSKIPRTSVDSLIYFRIAPFYRISRIN